MTVVCAGAGRGEGWRVWQVLGPWLAGGGAAGIVLGLARLAYRFHLDAIQAMRESRDAYREIASYERQRADLREHQLGGILDRASERL